MDKIYRPETRFLTFSESRILESCLVKRLQELKKNDPEIIIIKKFLKDFIYFTDSENIEDIKKYLKINGWISEGISQSENYETFKNPDATFDNGEAIKVVLPTEKLESYYSDDLIRRLLYFLGFLKNTSAYSVLKRIRKNK